MDKWSGGMGGIAPEDHDQGESGSGDSGEYGGTQLSCTVHPNYSGLVFAPDTVILAPDGHPTEPREI